MFSGDGLRTDFMQADRIAARADKGTLDNDPRCHEAIRARGGADDVARSSPLRTPSARRPNLSQPSNKAELWQLYIASSDT